VPDDTIECTSSIGMMTERPLQKVPEPEEIPSDIKGSSVNGYEPEEVNQRNTEIRSSEAANISSDLELTRSSERPSGPREMPADMVYPDLEKIERPQTRRQTPRQSTKFMSSQKNEAEPDLSHNNPRNSIGDDITPPPRHSSLPRHAVGRKPPPLSKEYPYTNAVVVDVRMDQDGVYQPPNQEVVFNPPSHQRRSLNISRSDLREPDAAYSPNSSRRNTFDFVRKSLNLKRRKGPGQRDKENKCTIL